MTANPGTLEKIVNTIRSEVPKYLSPEFVVHDVTAENRPGPDDEDYVHIRVILEDGHPNWTHKSSSGSATTWATSSNNWRSPITRTCPTPTGVN